MKALLMVSPILLIATVSHANEAFRCVDGMRVFSVSQNSQGNYVGSFKNFTGRPEAYGCEHVGRGANFKCVKGDSIVTVRRGASGQMVVDFELAGDFYPDSGYLFQLACEAN